LTHLTTLGTFPSNITTKHDQELHDHLDRIEQHIASLEMAYQQRQDKEVQDRYMAQGASMANHSLLSGKVGDRLGAEDRQDTGDVSTATVAVTNHTENIPAHVAQVNAENET
jgi:hypothetical protein